MPIRPTAFNSILLNGSALTVTSGHLILDGSELNFSSLSGALSGDIHASYLAANSYSDAQNTGLSGVLNTRLVSTGSILAGKINILSGNLVNVTTISNSNSASINELFDDVSGLQTGVDNLNNIVLTTGQLGQINGVAQLDELGYVANNTYWSQIGFIPYAIYEFQFTGTIGGIRSSDPIIFPYMVLQTSGFRSNFISGNHSSGIVNWNILTGKPTSLAGYGITGALTDASGALFQPLNSSLSALAGNTPSSLNFNNISGIFSGLTITHPDLTGIFTQEGFTGSSGGVEQHELVLVAGHTFSNCLSVRNPSPTGYSSYTVRSNNGLEKLAIGWGNSGAGAPWQNISYLEIWPGTSSAPQNFFITHDGNYGGVGAGTRLYGRVGMVWNSGNQASEFNIYQLLSPVGGSGFDSVKKSFQFATQQVTGTGNGEPWVKFITSDTDCAFQFWKTQEHNLSTVISVGNSSPAGAGVTDHFLISAFNVTGGGWRETLRLNNLGTMLSFQGVTSSTPAFGISGAAINSLLADASNFAGFQSLYQRYGAGSPESGISAPVGAVYHRTNGGIGTSFYVKELGGTTNTGWIAK